jgi:hypothetical protein
MLTTSTVPESARATLRIIDGALEYLASKDGMAYFNEHEKKLRVRQKTKHLGFEREVINRLFSRLKDDPGVIVSDEVAVPGRRLIDLALSFADCSAFIEFGMYFGGFRTKYGADCKKVRDILDRQQAAIGVLIHFHFYEDWDDRVRNYFRQELSDTERGIGAIFVSCPLMMHR